LTKRFPGVVALDAVSFEIGAGRCHALCGENGAGKSTLGRVLAGIHAPDAGELRIDGKPVRFGSPADARAAGIAMVHQELAFCPNLSVAETLCRVALPHRYGVVSGRELRRRATDMLAAIAAEIDPDWHLGSLSVGQQQLVQIAGALGRGARILVFDEP